MQQVPGPQGAAGTNGTNGTNGGNAFTSTTAQFTVPAISSSVSVAVGDSTWATVGQPVFVQSAGFYTVNSKIDSTHLSLTNLGYSGNAAPTTIIASSSTITPAGLKGTDGTNGTGNMQSANNLSDVANVATSRSNLGLGSLAVKSTINNGDWSGTALAVVNGGTGATTAATARTSLGAQAQSALLDAVSAVGAAADKLMYFTGAAAVSVISLLSFMRTFLSSADLPTARANLGKVMPRYGLLAVATGVNVNSATSDNAVTIEGTVYRIDRVVVTNASISLTTATAGVFTAAGGGGTTIAADQVLSALTASTKFKDITLQAITGTDLFTAGTIYFRVGTAQGAAATADVYVFGWRHD